MGKNKHHNSTEQQVSEEIIKPLEETPKTPISSKQFVQKLKEEIKGISEDVLKAFISISPKIDIEENYRKVWDSTFKRK